jgi:hypothetical protein
VQVTGIRGKSARAKWMPSEYSRALRSARVIAKRLLVLAALLVGLFWDPHSGFRPGERRAHQSLARTFYGALSRKSSCS